MAEAHEVKRTSSGASPRLPTLELSPGVAMPVLGFGVGTAWFNGSRGEDAIGESVKMALDAGVRHIDEAEMYLNEQATGRALQSWLAQSGSSRAELFVTGKVHGSIDGLEGWSASVEEGCRRSLDGLGVGHFDLYLVHAPFQKGGAPFSRPLPAVWKEMEALVRLGLANAIGVSNWRVEDLEAVYDSAEIKPCINQVEFHPYLQQPELIDYCARKGIVVASYAGLKPLTAPELVNTRLFSQVLPRISAERDKTLAQILQRWNVQSPPVCRRAVISTTSQRKRLSQYIDALDGSWQLTETEMAEISAAGAENPYRFHWRQEYGEE